MSSTVAFYWSSLLPMMWLLNLSNTTPAAIFGGFYIHIDETSNTLAWQSLKFHFCIALTFHPTQWSCLDLILINNCRPSLFPFTSSSRPIEKKSDVCYHGKKDFIQDCHNRGEKWSSTPKYSKDSWAFIPNKQNEGPVNGKLLRGNRRHGGIPAKQT